MSGTHLSSNVNPLQTTKPTILNPSPMTNPTTINPMTGTPMTSNPVTGVPTGKSYPMTGAPTGTTINPVTGAPMVGIPSYLTPSTSQRIDDNFVEEMFNLINDEHTWKEKSRASGNLSVTYTRKIMQLDHKHKAIKYVTEMTTSVAALVDLLHDRMIERHKEWNHSFSEGRYVERFNENENVEWWKYSTGILVEDRDFLIARRKVTYPDGSVMLVDRSVARGDCPPIHGITRGDLMFQVRLFKPLANGRVKMSAMNMINLKGAIPTIFTNLVNPSYFGGENAKIRDIINPHTA